DSLARRQRLAHESRDALAPPADPPGAQQHGDVRSRLIVGHSDPLITPVRCRAINPTRFPLREEPSRTPARLGKVGGDRAYRSLRWIAILHSLFAGSRG